MVIDWNLPDPPDSKVPCAGFGQYFDLEIPEDDLTHAKIKEVVWGGPEDLQDPEERIRFTNFGNGARVREVIASARPALEICMTECPLANRGWCYEMVSPAHHDGVPGFTGVAAATVFYGGRPVAGEIHERLVEERRLRRNLDRRVKRDLAA
jgi:hypothetical protein